ncbi:hypothetical protein (plasmid) [Vibrio vulnificus YJ016]|uniref:Uncharacterized protein n=2 Tax=Vibrio vulnificus TaxID=672 RepID=A0A9P1JCG0_VIBVL|nr:hypothetical protein VVCECT4999_22875 [Vibrio vulnificus]BAC97784.1 hypothetical protein [Vibrio vulnificus YJ016]EGQ9240345.1 hypothetical protein [Vibrio vulnificus]EGQ9240528.1 hypothetical protein [Vibrio vulnificus]EGR0353773.1 hypothetical protein [Vibrio vulnificus]
MSRQSDKRHYFPIGDVERVEYPCQKCNQGFYRYTPNGSRIEQHNQMHHNCTHCNAVTFFTIPYPALKYKNRIFVDWETIKGQPIEKS